MQGNIVLSVENLQTHFNLDHGNLEAVSGVDFELPKNKTLALIGESGSGKSVTAFSIMRTIQSPGKIVGGQINFRRPNGEVVNLTSLKPYSKAMRQIRGGEIAMVFQEPISSLSPIHSIGAQLVEMIMLHRTKNKKEAKEIALDMLNKVGLPNPSKRFTDYPHQLSGGMCQRCMIAIALSCNPSLLIADEPTTALDVTVQAQILELVQELQRELGMSVLYITHDLGVVAEVADFVAVMYLGRIVEYGDTRTIFSNPLHPYTRRLLKAIPTFDQSLGVELESIEGNVPVPINFPRQCGFYSRCLEAIEGRCDSAVPDLVEVKPGHKVRCVLVSDEEKRKL